MTFETAIEVQAGAPIWLLASLGLGSASATLAILIVSWPAAVKAVLLLLLLLYLVREGLSISRQQGLRLNILNNGSIRLINQESSQLVELKRDFFLSRGLVLLAVANEELSQRLIISAQHNTPDQFRRLRVWLQHRSSGNA